MCFARPVVWGFAMREIHAWLSSAMSMGAAGWPRSTMSLRTHSSSRVATAADTYSASAVEVDTVGCRLLPQEMAAPFQVKTHPVVDRLVSGQPPKSASTAPANASLPP